MDYITPTSRHRQTGQIRYIIRQQIRRIHHRVPKRRHHLPHVDPDIVPRLTRTNGRIHQPVQIRATHRRNMRNRTPWCKHHWSIHDKTMNASISDSSRKLESPVRKNQRVGHTRIRNRTCKCSRPPRYVVCIKNIPIINESVRRKRIRSNSIGHPR